MLQDHLLVNEENRNHQWDEKFFKYISESYLRILSEDPQQGPDSWPYLMTETTIENTNKNISGNSNPDLNFKSDSAQKIIHWLSTRGIGLVINPKRLPYPDYVFSYGMIWSFRETGFFIKYNDKNASQEFVLDKTTQIKIGPPTLEYLPKYVRDILKNFFIDQGVFEPRVLMVAPDGENFDLCFSIESLGNPPQTEHQGILEAISWFLPPHYSLALVSEKGFEGFLPL